MFIYPTETVSCSGRKFVHSQYKRYEGNTLSQYFSINSFGLTLMQDESFNDCIVYTSYEHNEMFTVLALRTVVFKFLHFWCPHWQQSVFNVHVKTVKVFGCRKPLNEFLFFWKSKRLSKFLVRTLLAFNVDLLMIY